MKIIVGLGNPEDKKYKLTRHNAGINGIQALMDFWTDPLVPGAAKWIYELKFKSLICDTIVKEQRIIFMYPQTYMNESGSAVKAICDFYKIDPAKDLLVVHDDSDLPLGTVRATESSSSAGHNGVQDIIDKLGTQNFHRIRIGVDTRPPLNPPLSNGGNGALRLPTEAFVLQNFTNDELTTLNDEILPKVKSEIEKFLQT
jgi:PTH1 family peptidyl-tRNA hydrolase